MKSVCVFLVIVALASAAKLPDYLTKCSKSDPKLSECLVASVKKAWPTIIKGDNTYHLTSLSPLKVNSVHVSVGNNRLVGTLFNAVFNGLQDAEVKDIKWDLANKRIDTKFFMPALNMAGDYAVSGRIIGLPLEGKGIANVTFANMDQSHSMEYETVEKNGQEYIEIRKTEMSYTTSRLSLTLGNLFNGDLRLGLAMNEVLNENWAPLNKEVNPELGNAIGEVYSQVLQEFYRKVPINEMLSD